MRRITQIKDGYRVRFRYPQYIATSLGERSYSKSFTMPTHPDMDACMAAAVARRDELEADFDLLVRDWDGDGGISRIERWMNDRNRPLCGWRASWREGPAHNRRSREKMFTFVYGDRKGEALAKQKAKRHRFLMILEHHSSGCHRTKW